MQHTLDTLLLLALPASGKSEVRRFLHHVPEDTRIRDFRMGQTVQLDDFPYVHFMRTIDEVLAKLGHERVFFHADDKPLIDEREWGTLIHLLNEDYSDLLTRKSVATDRPALRMFERIDHAASQVGIRPRLQALGAMMSSKLESEMEVLAGQMMEEKVAAYPDSLEGKTIVIEFARGGPDGSDMPLPSPYGYGYSLGQLSDEILSRASILYIEVTPEESRRKNTERTDPDDPGSILNHGVPMSVMMEEYGCDDMRWLAANSERPNTVQIRRSGKSFHLPFGAFDNNADKTTFVREDQKRWRHADVDALRAGLEQAVNRICDARDGV